MLRIMGVLLLCLTGALFFFCEADDEDECGGARVGGHCWYLGDLNQSCAEVCASRGGYNAGTRTYAGYPEGTDANCKSVLTALNAGTGEVDFGPWSSLGCFYYPSGYVAGMTTYYRSRDGGDNTDADGKGNFARRACACNK